MKKQSCSFKYKITNVQYEGLSSHGKHAFDNSVLPKRSVIICNVQFLRDTHAHDPL